MIRSEGTVRSLFTSAARRGNIPDAQMTYLDTDFMDIAQEELMAYALPVLHARRDDYYLEELMFDVANPDTLIGSDSPSSVRNLGFRLPAYAMAGTVRDVQAVSAGGSFYNLGRISVDDVPNSTSQAWYFYGNYLVYQQNSIGSVAPPIALRCIVHVKPNRMFPDDLMFSTLGNDSGGSALLKSTQVTQVNSPTSLWVDYPSVGSDGATFDIISGEPGYEVKTRNAIATTIAGNVVTLSTAPKVPVRVGDWLTGVG